MAEQAKQTAAADAMHDAGGAYCFIVAKVDAGAFKVFARDPNYCDGAFYPWHENEIRHEGANALARWIADRARVQIATLENPDATTGERATAECELANLLSGSDRVAEDFDAATALLPYLEGVPDPWRLAEKIACARPWERSRRAAECEDDLPF